MESTFTAVAIVVALAVWHLRNRRHPGWHASDNGRSYLLCGYSVAASSVYWLAHPPVTVWQWLFAFGWAMAGVAAFVLGFDALDRATADASRSATDLEAIMPAEQLTSGAD